MSDGISREEKIINCDLEDNKLFYCILSQLDEVDIEKITQDPTLLHSKTIMNCLNAGLLTCLGKQIHNFASEGHKPRLELTAIKNENGLWKMNQVKIILDERINEDEVILNINQCLKFIKKGCKIREDVKFSVINKETVKNLKHFKVDLLEIKNWLRKIKSDKAKQAELFSFFKEIASNKK